MRSIPSALLVGGLTLACTLAASSTASAQATTPVSQDLPFTTIVQSPLGGPTNAAQQVITNDADYAAFFGGNPPSTPSVDFSSEDVLAVALGTEPTGGYSIQIDRVEYMTGGITGGFAFVHFHQTQPAPGAIVNMMVTSPVHVVKLAKQATRYLFTNASTTAPAATFDSLSLSDTTGTAPGIVKTISLDATGKALCTFRAHMGATFSTSGQATAGELQAIQAAFANADPATLPNGVPDPRNVPGVHRIELGSTVAGQTYTFDASLDYYKSYTSRVKPLVDALEALTDRVQNGSKFDEIVVAHQGGFIAFADTYTIAKDGAFTVNRQPIRNPGGNQVWTDQATPAELAAVQQAFAGADVTTLPATIQRSHFIPDIGSTKLSTTIGGQSYDCFVQQSGDYGSYDARIRPLVEAVQAIASRVIQQHQTQTINGLVDYDWNSGNLIVGQYSIDASDPFYGILENQYGSTVTFDATVDPATNVATVASVQGTPDRTLNFRAAASLHAKILGHVKKGTNVPIMGQSSDGNWYQVVVNGQKGWLWADFVVVGQ